MEKIYAVYGPSAEYGDGQGVHGVFRTKQAAEEHARELCKEDVDAAIQALADDAFLAPLFADERRIRRARRRVRSGRGISWATAAETLGWPYNVREYFVATIGPNDPEYGDLADWMDAEQG